MLYYRNSLNKCTIIICGEPGVGKSSCILKYVCDKFSTKYEPTLEDSYNHKIEINGETIDLEILDSAGQEEFCSLKDSYSKIGEAFVLVYSVTCRGSFKEINRIRDSIILIKENSDIPMIIVGNKIDIDEKQRCVTKIEGEKLAQSLNCKFIETSAKENINISKIFSILVKDWATRKQQFKRTNTKTYGIKNINHVNNNNNNQQQISPPVSPKKEKQIIISSSNSYNEILDNNVLINNVQQLNTTITKTNSDDSIRSSKNKKILKLNYSTGIIQNNNNNKGNRTPLRQSKSKCFVQ